MNRRKRPVASGKPHGHQLRANVGFDPDTFAEIADRARREKVTFAEAVRLLVTWGLETASAGGDE
jgi:hypothetical protein